MTPFERLERIQRVIRLMGWASDQRVASIQVNEWLLCGDQRDRYHRPENPPKGRWVGTYAGHTVEGDTPDEAAAKLETVVFDAILRSIDSNIAEAEKRAKHFREAKTIMLDAMNAR